jgi:membrane protein DedA with SNARE-associated domain
MISAIVAKLAQFTIGVVGAMGYGGIVLLMAIESACIPLPSEIIMPFAGYLVYQGQFTLQGAAIAGAVGCVVGSIPAYYLGQYGGRPLIERWGRYVLLSPKELDFADRLFQRWGQWVVFAARLLPVVRTFIAFPAGVSRMPMGKFIAFTFAGSYPWCLALAWAGAKAGDKWDSDPRFKAIYHRFELVIVIAAVAAVTWFVWHKVREARRERPAKVAAASPDEA